MKNYGLGGPSGIPFKDEEKYLITIYKELFYTEALSKRKC